MKVSASERNRSVSNDKKMVEHFDDCHLPKR
jgi:hypothetical protein